MLMRPILALSLLLALFVAPLGAVGRTCGMSMPALQKMQCTACCAAMKSCVLPQQNPTRPTAASTVDQQSVVLIAPAVPLLLREIPVTPVTAPRFIAQSLAHSPPRLALFCTFLI